FTNLKYNANLDIKNKPNTILKLVLIINVLSIVIWSYFLLYTVSFVPSRNVGTGTKGCLPKLRDNQG
ncbi:MAG: hypothetical protein PSX42_10105, partial [bacterium]|nr:hypothetical protein [bacterium]